MSQPFSIMVSNVSDEYYTPPDIIERARAVLGRIDLDPASSPEANEIVGADTYWTRKDNGISKEWFGKVWLNPPFSEVRFWVAKLELEIDMGHVEEAILLCKAALGYKWFETLWRKYYTCLFRDRVQFIGGPGKAKQGTAILYLGTKPAKFIKEFSEYGRIVPPERV